MRQIFRGDGFTLARPPLASLNSGTDRVSLLSLIAAKYCIASNRPILRCLFRCIATTSTSFFRNKILFVSLICCICVSNHIGMCVARVCLLWRKRADEGVWHRTEALLQAHPSLMLPLNPMFVFTSRVLSSASSSIVCTAALLSVLISASSSAL